LDGVRRGNRGFGFLRVASCNASADWLWTAPAMECCARGFGLCLPFAERAVGTLLGLATMRSRIASSSR
jgi:hypothetical protein